jgi:hypothetical protein
MYIETVGKKGYPPSILLRESYREGGRVRKRTLLNLTKWPSQKVEALRATLRGGVVLEKLEQSFEIERSLPHGHVAAVLGKIRQLGLPRILSRSTSHERTLVIALLVARIIKPLSKLATARELQAETLSSSLADVLQLTGLTEDHLYQAMDWLGTRQEQIEKVLARKHLTEPNIVLYDVTSSYFEGNSCILAHFGYSRDKKRGKKQIVFGLLCNQEGCPIAVKVFKGNTGDPSTVASQLQKLREEFGFTRIIMIGDRGMLTSARIREELEPLDGIKGIFR